MIPLLGETIQMIPDWPRPRYKPEGGNPFLFYAIYGQFDLSQVMDKIAYRTAGVSPGLDAARYGVSERPDLIANFHRNHLWEELVQDQPSFAKNISDAPECLIIQGTPQEPSDLNYLRDVVGLISHFSDHGAMGIYDPQMFHWWKPEEWKAKLFNPKSPVPSSHVTLFQSQEKTPSRRWFHTRGMRKFGRPDLSIKNVPVTSHRAVEESCERLIQLLAMGEIIKSGQKVDLDANHQGIPCTVSGNEFDPEFNNAHIEVIWPSLAVD